MEKQRALILSEVNEKNNELSCRVLPMQLTRCGFE